jgi:hypothetical protein
MADSQRFGENQRDREQRGEHQHVHGDTHTERPFSRFGKIEGTENLEAYPVTCIVQDLFSDPWAWLLFSPHELPDRTMPPQFSMKISTDSAPTLPFI